MLAQNFKTAADLGITEDEQIALIQVLGMLERGELKYAESDRCRGENLFNMGTWGDGCRTPACIGGWVAHLLGVYQMDYVRQYSGWNAKADHGLRNLYWPGFYYGIKPANAAMALRSYLTIGDARWDLARS